MANYKFKLFLGSDDLSIEEYTKLKSRAYSDSDDITIIKEETKLTESGEYLIALHWLENGSSSEDKDTLRRMIEDKV